MSTVKKQTYRVTSGGPLTLQKLKVMKIPPYILISCLLDDLISRALEVDTVTDKLLSAFVNFPSSAL